MTKRGKNTRSLDVISAEIHTLERASIFAIGDILCEARGQCERAQFLDWLETEFEYSEDSASRYMKVAELGSRFRNLRKLKLGKTSLYQLADHEPEDELPAIIAELAKHATGARLKPADAERVIAIGLGRHRFGNHPDATLYQLGDLRVCEEPWYKKAIAALKKQQPTDDDAADAIVNGIRDRESRLRADEAEDEVIKQPTLSPSPPPPSSPLQLPTYTPRLDATLFDEAVRTLCRLSTRQVPVADLINAVPLHDLNTANDFIAAALAAASKKASLH